MACRNDNPKSRLRQEVGKRLAELGQDEIRRRSALACGHLLDQFANPGSVMAYLALPGELDPAGAIAMWRTRGVTVAAPRIDWVNKAMTPAVLTGDRGQLVETRHGLREPGPDAPELAIGEIGLLIVPGLAFTACKARLGRGGGFYDRFLSRLGAATRTVGLVLSCQIVDEIPIEPHDRSVDAVITEDGPV
jgi:5-formyltetrahydrofolate cyclo-ligase